LGPVLGCDRLVSIAKVIENQVMVALVISISSDVSVDSVESYFPRVILISSISVEVSVASELYLVEGSRDQVGFQYSYYYSIKEYPITYNEAMKSPDIDFWKEAIHDEIGSIMGNDMWALSDLPPGCKPLGIDKFKTRLQPKGFVMLGNEHKVCRLVKSLYGLKQAPKQWHQKFDEVVLSSGFLLNQSDKCVNRKFNNSGKGVIIFLYVDDMLIFGTDQNQVDKTKKFLSSIFSMKDMGEANVILGIKIKRENKGIVITQSHYIKKILKKFNHEDCSSMSTLMNPVEKLKPNTGKLVDQLEYSRAIGCLMYAMTSTRPNIAYAVNRLSRKATDLIPSLGKKFAIQYSKPENPNELFQKLLEDFKELTEYDNSPKIATLNSNEEKEEPPQDSDIQLLCIHDNVDDLIESARNSKLLLINSNSQRLDNKGQEVKNVVEQPAERGNHSIQSLQNFRVVHKNSIFLNNTSQISSIHAIAPILSTKEPEHSLSMRYEHLSITLETESDEVTESNAENLLPIPSECEVTLEEKRECDMPFCENFPVCDDHSEIFSDSKINDDNSVYDDDFEDVEYVEASLSDPEIVSIEEENDVEEEESDNSLSDNFSPEFETFCDHTEETRSGITTTLADNSLLEYDSFCFEIDPNQERLINVMKNDIPDNSSNDPLLEEADLFLTSDNSIPPGTENVADDSEGDIRFLEELLIYDSILSHESSDSNFEDNPSIPRPPLEPPDVKTDAEEIPVVMNDKDKFDEDYYFFMFVKVFSLLFAKSEDTIFDPGISV
nr:zinc finger, CCHC-type [Tanacetum cinerariifolium]